MFFSKRSRFSKYPRSFDINRKGAGQFGPNAGGKPVSVKDETNIIRKVLSYRPGEKLPQNIVSQLPKTKYDRQEGRYRRVGEFWPGPTLTLSDNEIIQEMKFGMPSTEVMIDGMETGMTIEDMRKQFPNLKLVMEKHGSPPGSCVRYRRYETVAPQGWRVVAYGRNENTLEGFRLIEPCFNDDIEQVAEQREKDKQLEDARRLDELAALDGERIQNLDSDLWLRDWAARKHPEIQELAEKLISARPVDWYDIVFDINWDNGTEPLQWIVQQRQASTQTLFEIFLLSEPDYFCQPERLATGHLADEYALICDIRDRLENGYYVSKIPFDGITHWDNRYPTPDSSDVKSWRKVFRRQFPLS